jgi:predicted ABC-type transport system involved in lysophospholipase L1 biosynthesis ATPase subunit
MVQTMPNANDLVLEGKELAKDFLQGEAKIEVLRSVSIRVRAGERIVGIR